MKARGTNRVLARFKNRASDSAPRPFRVNEERADARTMLVERPGCELVGAAGLPVEKRLDQGVIDLAQPEVRI